MAPGVVDSHGVVGGDGPVDEREFFLFIVVQLSVARRDVVFFPPLEDCFLVGDEIDFGVYPVEVAWHVYYSPVQALKMPELTCLEFIHSIGNGSSAG